MGRAFAVLLIALAAPALAADGEALYAMHCAVCHGPAGEGTSGLAPPLSSPMFRQAEVGEAKLYVPLVVINGLAGPIEVEGRRFVGAAMPPLSHLSHEEIAAITVHVLARLNGLEAKMSAREVGSLRPTSHAGLLEMRARLAP